MKILKGFTFNTRPRLCLMENPSNRFCVNQMIKSIIYLLKTGDSDRNREKDDYDGTNDTLRTDSVGYAQKDMGLCQHGS